METSDIITFYHVTFQGNLKSIKNEFRLQKYFDPMIIGLLYKNVHAVCAMCMHAIYNMKRNENL